MEARLSRVVAPFVTLQEAEDCSISTVVMDSRDVIPGALFIASCAPLGDGSPFIEEAIARGANAIIQQSSHNQAQINEQQNPQGHRIICIKIPDLAAKIGEIAANFYDNPSKKMPIIGITGTNGKTTVSYLLAQALCHLQRPCSVLGTIGYGPPQAMQRAQLTTPMPTTLQQLLAQQWQQGSQAIAMEVSSHSLVQQRVAGIAFHTAVFTNLSRDHLDYHGTMANYGAAKARLFAWPSLKNRVINGDDAFGQQLITNYQSTNNTFVYGLNPKSSRDLPSVWVREVTYTPEGIKAHVETPWGTDWLQTPLLGSFNLVNLLAVITVLGAMDYPLSQIFSALQQVQAAPGRMQLLTHPGQAKVIIDYSHTPAALEAALIAIKQHYCDKIFCIFGCGGDRDRGKRPLMGAIAEKYSDYPIITNDNPRHEEPQAIVADILQGMASRGHRVELDRAQAIGWALQQATAEDVILIAGKGHEDYQQIHDERRHFSDEEQVRAQFQQDARC